MALADSRGSLTLAVSRPAALIREGSEAVERRLRALEAKRPLELEVVTRPSDASAGPRCWPPASETRCATPDVWRPTSLDSASSRSFREPRATTTTASWRSGCRTSSATPTPRPSCSPISWAMADSPKRCSAHAARRVRPPRQSPELRPPAQPSPRPRQRPLVRSLVMHTYAPVGAGRAADQAPFARALAALELDPHNPAIAPVIHQIAVELLASTGRRLPPFVVTAMRHCLAQAYGRTSAPELNVPARVTSTLRRVSTRGTSDPISIGARSYRPQAEPDPRSDRVNSPRRVMPGSANTARHLAPKAGAGPRAGDRRITIGGPPRSTCSASSWARRTVRPTHSSPA